MWKGTIKRLFTIIRGLHEVTMDNKGKCGMEEEGGKERGRGLPEAIEKGVVEKQRERERGREGGSKREGGERGRQRETSTMLGYNKSWEQIVTNKRWTKIRHHVEIMSIACRDMECNQY